MNGDPQGSRDQARDNNVLPDLRPGISITQADQDELCRGIVCDFGHNVQSLDVAKIGLWGSPKAGSTSRCEIEGER
jgi:hypothetical protein